MLGISNIGERQATTYYTKDGYYARNESDDRWQGSLREELGLLETITHEDFHRLTSGKKRAGYDLCFSAPKSVSIAMTVSAETRQDMLAAHHAAVKATLAKIEQREIGTRVRDGKRQNHVKTGNMLAGCFTHYVSRNSDPQLHTHAVVLNITKYEDSLYAVDNPPLYENKILYGQIYRNHLARELMQRGYEITPSDTEKGFFDLRGIPQTALEQFSSRRQEILKKLSEWGIDTPEAAEKAALLTRKAKQHKDLDALMTSWRETLAEMGGIEIEKQISAIVPSAEQKHNEFVQGIADLAGKSFAFTDKEMKRSALAAGVGSGLSEAEYEEYLAKALAAKTLLPLSTAQGDTYYSTPQNVETERQIFGEVTRSRNTMLGIEVAVANSELDHALAINQTALSGQQRQAVLHIATTSDQYVAIQGLAGTGKTHMLNFAREVLEGAGYTVHGACFTGKAASGLQTDAQIDSTTIHAFLNRLEKEAGKVAANDSDRHLKTEWDFTGLKPGKKREAWVVDEASLVDNSTMLHVMKASRMKGAKVILVGDRQQLLPIGVGNAFSALTESGKISTVTLDEIRRQKNPEVLGAVREAVAGDLDKSLNLLRNDTKVIEKRAARLKAIVKDYVTLSKTDRDNTVILTAANRDRREINEAVREELVKRGQLSSGQEFTVAEPVTGKEYKRNFAPGDKIIFLQNDYKAGVRNGQTGTVKEIVASTGTMVIASGNKEIPIHLSLYKAVDHGYAMTSHKAQGITADRVLVHLDSTQKHLNSRNAYYVDISRARHQIKIYVDDAGRIQKQIKHFATKLSTEDFISAVNDRKTLTPKRADIFQELRAIKLPEIQHNLGKGIKLRR